MDDHGVSVPPNSRPIPGYLGYAVSADGQVFSRWRRGWNGGLTQSWYAMKLRRPRRRSPYLRVGLTRDGKQKQFPVHQLVLLAYAGPHPEGKPHTRHLDGDPLNNRLENLVYGTAKENALDTVRHGRVRRGLRTRCGKLTEAQAVEVYRQAKTNVPHRLIAARFGISASTVGAILAGRAYGWVTKGVDVSDIIPLPCVVGTFGEWNGCAKLTEADVLEIRQRYAAGERQTHLAREFGVTQSNISEITLRHTWKHVSEPHPREVQLLLAF